MSWWEQWYQMATDEDWDDLFGQEDPREEFMPTPALDALIDGGEFVTCQCEHEVCSCPVPTDSAHYVKLQIWTRHDSDGESYEVYKLPDGTEYRGNLYARLIDGDARG